MGSCVSTSKTGTVVQTAHILPSTQPAKPKRTPEVNVVTPVAHHQVEPSRPVGANRRKSSGRNNDLTPTHNYFAQEDRNDRKTPSPISDKPTNVIEVKPMVEKKNVEVQVANPPDRAKDDSSISSRNGQLANQRRRTEGAIWPGGLDLKGTGSLTVLKRSNSRPKPLNSRTPSEISIDSDSQIYASLDLGLEKLPPIDTPEASHVCSIRLRYILKRLAKDDIAKDDLVKNLEYAASVLETVYIDETREESPCRPYGTDDRGTNLAPSLSDGICDKPVIDSLSYRLHPNSHQSRRTNRRRRRLCDEDDELSEVEPDAVPSEVRDWLALTFTRSMSNMKRRGDDKPKFRSVAHAIRAGIMVDRIYRRMSSSVGLHIPPNVLIQLKGIEEWSFDVFSVSEAGDGHALKYVGYELLQRYDLIHKFKMNTNVLEAFLGQLEAGYSKHGNPYHNLMHAADVAHTTYHIISHSKLAHWLTDLEIFATIIAALIHDFEHTGTTNNFHVQTGSDVALLYNDRAVLENHHISAAFRLLKDDEFNILSNLSRDEYREFRSLVIDMVLATDMSFHFQQIKNMKNLLSMPEKGSSTTPFVSIDKSKALSLLLHCADISHPAKDWDLHHRWTSLLLEEFFQQGDMEQDKGLPFSPLCDREKTLVAESQIGFIDFIVDPSFQVMGDMLQKILAPLHQPSQLSTRSINDAIKEESNEKQQDRSTSTTSLSSRPATPKSPTGMRYELDRVWQEPLARNKSMWKEKATADAILRQQKAAALTNDTEASDAPADKPADDTPANDDKKDSDT